MHGLHGVYSKKWLVNMFRIVVLVTCPNISEQAGDALSLRHVTGWVVGLRLFGESYGEGYSLKLLDGSKNYLAAGGFYRQLLTMHKIYIYCI